MSHRLLFPTLTQNNPNIYHLVHTRLKSISPPLIISNKNTKTIGSKLTTQSYPIHTSKQSLSTLTRTTPTTHSPLSHSTQIKNSPSPLPHTHSFPSRHPHQITPLTSPTFTPKRYTSTSKPPAKSPTEKPPKIGWLSKRVSRLRLWGNRGLKEEDKWDPWETPVRDVEIGKENSNLIIQNAEAMRLKQLEQIQKYKKKVADKEASIKTPLAFKAQQKANKVPFLQKIKNAWNFLKNPKNILHSYFYNPPPASELSLTQQLIFLHWKYSLSGFVLFLLLFPRIPIVNEMINELSRHRDRKRRGVIGLDEYCNPEKQFAKLTFFRTNDWTFDINYLQKMVLRDIYVVKNINTAMDELTTDRLDYLEQILAQLIKFETQPNKYPSHKLTPFQRDAILHITQYHKDLSDEKEQAAGFSKIIKSEWHEQADIAWKTSDVQVTTFWNTYLLAEHRRERLLNVLIDHQKSIQKWREALEDEYNRHLARTNEVEMILHQIMSGIAAENKKPTPDSGLLPTIFGTSPIKERSYPGLFIPQSILDQQRPIGYKDDLKQLEDVLCGKIDPSQLPVQQGNKYNLKPKHHPQELENNPPQSELTGREKYTPEQLELIMEGQRQEKKQQAQAQIRFQKQQQAQQSSNQTQPSFFFPSNQTPPRE